MKKLIGLVSVLAASLIPITASAQIDAEIDGIGYYLDNDDKTAEVTSGKAGDVVIPSTVSYEGNTYTVTTIGNRAFKEEALKSVRLPNTINKIGKEAFYGNSLLEYINIPEGVKKIENYTFYGCWRIHSITLPEGLQSIGDYAFAQRQSDVEYDVNYLHISIGLHSIVIPNSVTNIGSCAFLYTANLKTVVLPENLTTIKESAFYGCGITSIVIPQSVRSIQDHAFQESLLTEVILPEGLQSLGKYAFSQTPLTSINIPKGITALPDYLLKKTLLTSFDIPNHVTSIGEGTFSECVYLSSINIPNSVTKIGDNAFDCCYSILSITIPNSVTEIGGYAFSGTKIRKIRLPEKLTSINAGLFMHCNRLSSVVIPNSVRSIGEEAFWNCDLEAIDIPNSVTTIASKAFNGSIATVSIGTGINIIAANAFDLGSSLDDLYCYATTAPSINLSAFKGTSINYATLHVPNSSIDSYSKRAPWSEFGTIVGIDESVVKPKCATPTITYENNKLHFTCATLNSECVADIEDADVTRHYGSEVQLGATYIIKVFATASGYDNSDVATATLCWIDQQPQMEGITGNVAQVPANAVLIQSDGGMLTVQGIDDNTIVRVYDISGAMLGASTSRNGMACINTNLQSEAIVIVKIGDKSVKVKMN